MPSLGFELAPFEYDSLFTWRWSLFEFGGTVFIMNSKINLRKISLKAYLKVILHHFGLNSFSGSTADGCTELKLVFDLINWSHRSAGKEPIHCWFASVLGKSKVLTVKSRSETRFWIKHDSALVLSLYGVFSGLLGQCISVTYPRRTSGIRLDNLGVRMRLFLQKKKTKTIWKPFLWLSRLLGNHCGGFSFNYNRNVAVKRHRVSLSW